jgi:hypothetical protein
VQKELLETHPEADLRVYAVWFSMVPGDARSEWPQELLTDPRVVHRWDEAKALGTWYARRTPSMRERISPESKWNDGDVLWDTYLLYGADARWKEDTAPTDLKLWGRTIVAARESLRAYFESK